MKQLMDMTFAMPSPGQPPPPGTLPGQSSPPGTLAHQLLWCTALQPARDAALRLTNELLAFYPLLQPIVQQKPFTSSLTPAAAAR